MSNTYSMSFIKEALHMIRPVAKESVPNILNEFESLLQAKKNAQQGTIMIYGMYSHGKSTLINALLGKESAPEGASPTTSELTPYMWEGGSCILLDTPGIEAMSKDSLKAQKALEQSELVAFIVESGAVEAELVWSELVRLVDKGKKTCLIINDWDGFMHDTLSIERVKDSFRHHMQDMAERLSCRVSNIVEAVPLFFVNAKQAKQARLNNRADLLAISGLPELEESLVRMVSSLSLSDTVNVLRRNLLNMIALCRCALARDNGNTLLAAAEESLRDIQITHDNARTNVIHAFEQRLAQQRPQLYNIFETIRDQTTAENALGALARSLMEDMDGVIREELTKAGQSIEKTCETLDKIRLELSPNLLNNEDQSDTPNVVQHMLQSFDWSNLLKAVKWEEYVKEGIVTVLKTLKEWLPSLFKGVGSVTFGKWASFASRALGVIAAVGTVIYEVYSGFAAEEKAREAEQRKAQAIADAVNMTMQGLRDAFIRQFDTSLQEIFDRVLKPMEESVRNLRTQMHQTNNQEKILNTVESMLQSPA